MRIDANSPLAILITFLIAMVALTLFLVYGWILGLPILQWQCEDVC